MGFRSKGKRRERIRQARKVGKGGKGVGSNECDEGTFTRIFSLTLKRKEVGVSRGMKKTGQDGSKTSELTKKTEPCLERGRRKRKKEEEMKK